MSPEPILLMLPAVEQGVNRPCGKPMQFPGFAIRFWYVRALFPNQLIENKGCDIGLKIRVSVVRFRPEPPKHHAQPFSVGRFCLWALFGAPPCRRDACVT